MAFRTPAHLLLASSFALAGQTATKPTVQPKVAQSQTTRTNQKTQRVKTHRKHHKKHHANASKK